MCSAYLIAWLKGRSSVFEDCVLVDHTAMGSSFHHLVFRTETSLYEGGPGAFRDGETQ